MNSPATANWRPEVVVARRGLATFLLLVPCVSSQCLNTCSYASDGACDDGGPGADYSYCNLGTDCYDCGSRGLPPSPPPPSSPPVLLLDSYRISFGGYVYRTLESGVLHSGSNVNCQDEWLPMPSGYEVAPDDAAVRNAMVAFTWSTHVLVFASRMGYTTAAYRSLCLTAVSSDECPSASGGNDNANECTSSLSVDDFCEWDIFNGQMWRRRW